MRRVHLPLTPGWLHFPEPWVWTLLLLLALPLLWWVWQRPGRRPVVRFSDLGLVARSVGMWPTRLRMIPGGLRLAALACLIVAVARPQRADETSRVYVEGIAIQMAVDTSSSMRDLDLAPPGTQWTRLDVVKDVFRRFVVGEGDLPGRPDDLIGMIRFARYADAVCPLTLNRDALLDVLSHTNIVTERSEDGTAIGDGLALAVERLRDLKRVTGSGEQLVIRSRVVILLTDGENNAGEISPEQAGELAALYGIKVYTILAGTGQALQQMRWDGSIVVTGRRPVNDRDMRRIAEVTGGKFYRADDRDSLQKIYEEIDQLERTRAEERRFVRWQELAGPLLLAALACVGLQSLLDATWLRKIP